MSALRRSGLSIRVNALSISMASLVVANCLGGFLSNHFRTSITFESDTEHLPRVRKTHKTMHAALRPVQICAPQMVTGGSI